MKTISKTLLLTAMAAGLAACGGDETKKTNATSNSTQSIKTQQYHNAKINLQGETRDGVTNAPIDGVKITLIQGGSVRSVTTRNSEEAGLKGTYYMSGIPATVTNSGANDRNTYKIVISKEGYRTYEGDMTFSVAGVDDDKLQNAVFNRMAVFTLYPNSVVPADIKVYAHFNGKPLKSVSVTLRSQSTSSNFGTISEEKYVANVTATTDDKGYATFSGSKLVAGVSYRAYITPTTYTTTGDNASTTLLGYAHSGTVTAGSLNGTTVALPVRAANSDDGGLYITSANNDDEAAVVNTGKLVINFSENIKLVSSKYGLLGANCVKNKNDPDPTATDTAAVLGNIGTTGKNVTVSVTDNVLTITPNFSTSPNASTYNDVSILFKGMAGGTGSANTCKVVEAVYVRKATGGPAYQLTDIRNQIGTSGPMNDTVIAKAD